MNSQQADIFSFPPFSVRDLWIANGPMRQLLAEYTGLFHLGRNAIYWAFKGMDAPQGTPAWFPSFHCGVEVEAAAVAGFDIKFYRVGKDLRMDLKDLEKKLDSSPGPVLVIHYFGFPQPDCEALSDLCRHKGVPLVEDCTHALFSQDGNRPLGSYGPLAAFSLSKTLNIYLGGALQVDFEKFRDCTGRDFRSPPPTRPGFPIYRLFIKDYVRRLVGSQGTTLYRKLRYGNQSGDFSNLEPTIGETDVEFNQPPADYRMGMASLSRLSAGKAVPERIVERRRANYRHLSGMLGSEPWLRLIFPHLPNGVCPLVLPIWTENRDQLDRQLKKAGIHPYIFGLWRHPLLAPDTYPGTNKARRHILGLPIHQDLDERQLDRIAATAIRCSSGQ